MAILRKKTSAPNQSVGQPATRAQRALNNSSAYKTMTGKDIASTPATQNYASRSGVGALNTPNQSTSVQYSPTRTSSPVRTPVSTSTARLPVAGARTVATPAVTAKTVAPIVTKPAKSAPTAIEREQNLQIAADKNGLTGIERQKFIESGGYLASSMPTREQQLQIAADKQGLTGIERQRFVESGGNVQKKIAGSISLISPVNRAVSSTEKMRADESRTQADATALLTDVSTLSDSYATSGEMSANDKLMQDILASKSFGETEEGKTMMQNIVDMQNQLASGEYSDEEKARIQEQADATKAEYDALAYEAEQRKAQGMASSLVAAGQRGGLMNSQFSGVAANTTTAGNNFFGAGGELNRIQSDYDSQIMAIRSEGIKAVSDAKSAAEEAIRTGRKEDLEAAKSLFDMAKTAQNEAFAMMTEKQSAITSYQNQLIELQKYNRETASATITALAASGKTSEEIPDWYFQDLDKQSGYKEGTSRALFDVTAKEYSQKTATDAIEQAQALNNLLTSIPVGEKITIGDTTYQSLNKGETSVYSEDDGNGNVTVYSVNKDTGEVKTLKTMQGISAVDGEIITNNGVTAFVSRTGGVRVIYDANQPDGGIATGGIIEEFPQNSYSTFTDENGVPRTQCGEWVNDLTGLGVGDSLSSKISKTDASITAESAQVGDVIVTSEGGSTGHVAIINSISYDTNGNPVYTISESNYKKDRNGVGIITHDRTLSGNSRLIKGYARPGFNNDSYNFGTDTSALSNLFGTDDALVESYVSDYLSGRIGASSIPADIRNSVIQEAEATRGQYQSSPEMLAMQQITGLPADVRRQYEGSIISALSSDNPEQAQDLIAGAIYDAADVATKNKLDGRSETIDALQTIKSDLQTFYDEGGKSGIFAGTEEQIAKAVGKISDPALRAIATRIKAAIVNYRRAVSGAAFTASEAAEYESLFPNIKNGEELNMNTIDTILGTFNDATERFYRDRVGESNYDAIFSSSYGPQVDTDTQNFGEYGNYVSSKLLGRQKADGSELTQEEIAQIARAAQNALDNGESQEDILDTINSYLGY